MVKNINDNSIILCQTNYINPQKLYEIDDPIQYNLIPKDVLELLWFKDGKFQNYYPNKYPTYSQYSVKKSLIKSNYPISDKIEPSLISIRLPLGDRISPYDEVSYFPQIAYSSLTPVQRSTYLEWLKDITRQFDIGYVFLFFYGLERFMYLTDKLEESLQMIMKLRKYHKNKYFLKSSGDSIIGALILRQKWDLLRKLLEIEEFDLSAIHIAAMTMLEMSLNAKQLISIRKSIGFKNDLYIKRDYEYFLKLLKVNLLRKYGEEGFPLKHIYWEDSKKNIIQFASNRSLDKWYINSFHIYYSNIFIGEVYSILYETHQDFKKTYKEYIADMQNKPCGTE